MTSGGYQLMTFWTICIEYRCNNQLILYMSPVAVYNLEKIKISELVRFTGALERLFNLSEKIIC